MSDEDYGVFVCIGVLLVDLNGTYWFKVKSGYSKPYDVAWYKLAGKPSKSLKEVFTYDAWADAYSDQSEVFTEALGVQCVSEDPLIS